MAKIVVSDFVTLDGVMQAPGDPNEDRSGGFEHGGWQLPYADEVLGKVLSSTMASTGGLLFGRKTYEFFAGYWPSAPDDNFLEGESLAAKMNSLPKYVASRTLREPLAWDNSRLIGDVAQEVPSLRDELGKDILVLGSGEVVRSLLENDLVDELRLSIVPLILGPGKRLFGEGVPTTELKLAAVEPTTTGALLVTYRRAQGD